ncbi:MAG TPA: beta-xylosidase [Burkholderiaceae bacterium]|nr:beta-xylosidase [Burkholderiaceae bacterium]
MIEAIEFWNEPNNLSHWDYEIDPEWREFAQMTRCAGRRVAELAPQLVRVLGGLTPIDPAFVRLLEGHGVLEQMDAVAIHGFPWDWSPWSLAEWPRRVEEIEAVTQLPVWVTEVGVSSFDSEKLQVQGLRRTAELLARRVQRVHWYSLFDLPRAWPATISRYERAEGAMYERHYNMGLVREDGVPKPAADAFDGSLGICQWFHWHDPRLDDAVRWLRRLNVRRLRTGISWADWHRDAKLAWFDRQMDALAEFDLTVVLCFTPPSRGRRPCHTSPPIDYGEFVWFAEEIVRRYVRCEGWAPTREIALADVAPLQSAGSTRSTRPSRLSVSR